MKSTEKLDLLNRVCAVLNDMGHGLSVLERREMIERVTTGERVDSVRCDHPDDDEWMDEELEYDEMD